MESSSSSRRVDSRLIVNSDLKQQQTAQFWPKELAKGQSENTHDPRFSSSALALGTSQPMYFSLMLAYSVFRCFWRAARLFAE